MTVQTRTKAVLHVFRAADPGLILVKNHPDIDWAVSRSHEDIVRHAADADILVLNNRTCTPELGRDLRARVGERLKWIHFTTAGVELGLAMGLPAGVPVTCSSGINGPILAEHAMTLLLASLRRLNDIRDGQRAHEWRRMQIVENMRSLEGATVCIFGLGAVGHDLVRKLRAFDARVIAVSRAGADPAIDQVFPREDLHAALAQSDAIILCTNSDSSSRRMIDAAAIAAMKKGAVLINVARGELVDEAAMIAALRSGHLAAAGLDVTDPEPPSPANPLFDMANVILSPHCAGGGSPAGTAARQAKLFGENLRRFRSGAALLNLVDSQDC
jgi:phosphoglycerate dehydrogenase-like enzyme